MKNRQKINIELNKMENIENTKNIDSNRNTNKIAIHTFSGSGNTNHMVKKSVCMLVSGNLVKPPNYIYICVFIYMHVFIMYM